MHVCLRACLRARTFMCVCVCVCERERERGSCQSTNDVCTVHYQYSQTRQIVTCLCFKPFHQRNVRKALTVGFGVNFQEGIPMTDL